ncbi:proposed function:NRPS:C-A-PCP, non ribosomal peptide synthase, contains 1 condensation domain, 1 AMP-acid ligases II domain [Cupriavidus phytorum]|uniref:Proposed function:NRPS:C-A-PCP, non ribosomal peptide synthase, contains 1 condensation domain, 1 AMP-acid ligases II domain n=2 Tax=Cupriavidus TaxID=106589 RepID=A0A975XHA1_9BURK|nr:MULTISPECIES: amino acid adenylation domain-containing protein [Cupriavidus]PZX20939.1 amino acid adenylation domain-containing protein [Cupriavidus alkaliphilus]SOY70305.1 proposed function:NRPS:C-A-PCP, non ribosomal peptide synthase, contains 1 condensation domain, 1 AMP-acid ligases II domain [Cupriavidus taiwanensis]
MDAITQDFARHARTLGREQRALSAHAAMPVMLSATIEGPLDAQRLQRALCRVAARHPVTGLVFGRVEGLRGLRQHFAGALPAWSGTRRDPATPDTALRAALQVLDDNRAQLTLTAHPLAADGPSLVTLLSELAQAYAYETAPSGEAPLPYADYLDWSDGLAQENTEAGTGYWQAVRERLAGLDAPRLPWQRAGNADEALAAQGVELPATEAAAVAAWAAALGQPLAHALQAAWWLLLARLDPAAAFCAGWQHDCRDDFDVLAGAVGRYEALLPLAVQPDMAAPFADWLAAFGAQLQQHLDWREHCPADASAGAPARVGFCCRGPARMQWRHGDLHWHANTPPALLPGLALALHVHVEDGLPRQLVLHHADSVHGADAMACLLDQYRALLQTLRAAPHTAVGALPLATAAERARADAMHAPALHVGAQMLPQRLAHWANERPHAPALSAPGLQLSYAGLARVVDAVARQLPALGLRSDQPVGLLLPRSGELVVALLAVMRAGAPYLPLDPAWPPQRRAQILADAGATLVLTDAAHAPSAGPLPHADIAALLAADTAADTTPTLSAADAAQPAYVLYTSGSTGTPKGVAINHGQLLNYVAASGQALRLDRCQRFGLTSTVAADLGNTTLFGALWHGACLCVADEADMQHAAAFTAFLAREHVDCLKIVPSHLDALLDGDTAPLPLPPHATIVLGGEAASAALLQRLRARMPQARLCNHYGPTETTVGILVHDAGRAADAVHAPLPLTQVLANCEAYVRTATGQLAAVGETGELYLGGAQLCAGYLDGAVAGTAFVAHPERPGQRLYRSGDLARYLPRGGIELVGRADHQVKVRGFRIECGEVEQALAALPGVRQAVVMLVAPAGGLPQLATWIVPDDATATDAAALRNALRHALAERLPEAMIPALWFAVPALPRLPNGKVDRRALAQAAAAGPAPSSARPVREPASELEALLLDQLRDLLGAPGLAVHDDLFEAGGHSLLVIKLVARIRKLLKLEIAPAMVFDAPHAAALALALRGASADPDGLETLAGLQRQLAAMSPEARAALRASGTANATA